MIPHDKALHFIAGSIIFTVLHFVTVELALIGVLIAAFGKEIYDYLHRDKHTPEAMDALATIAGGAIGWLNTF